MTNRHARPDMANPLDSTGMQSTVGSVGHIG